MPLSAAGVYQCIAWNNLGTVTNQSATLTVLRSTPEFGSVRLVPGGGFSMELQQLSGHGPVIIYASSNLLAWVPIFTNPPVTGTLQFVDTTAANAPSRFYRVVEE